MPSVSTHTSSTATSSAASSVSSPSADTARAAFEYLLQHLKDFYRDASCASYLKECNLPYVPTSRPNAPHVRVTDCYIEPALFLDPMHSSINTNASVSLNASAHASGGSANTTASSSANANSSANSGHGNAIVSVNHNREHPLAVQLIWRPYVR